MFADDAVKLVEGGIEITMTNVISPLSVDEVPDDVENYLDGTVDGKSISTEDKKKFKIKFGGMEFNIKNAKEFAGKVIPVGEKVTVFLPFTGISKGEEHEFGILIKTEHPFELAIKRTVH